MRSVPKASVIALLAALGMAISPAVADDDKKDSNSSKTLNEQGADYVEKAGKGTWVQPYTDSVAEKIRKMDKEKESSSSSSSKPSEKRTRPQ